LPETYVLIGNISVPLSWIAFLGAAIVTVCLLRWSFGKAVANLFSDYLFTFILVWKFSVVLTDFNVIWKSPWTILYFNGGTVGVLCALFAVAIHVLIHIRQQKLHTHQLYALSIGTMQLQSIIQIVFVIVYDETGLTRIVTVIGFSCILFMTVRWKEPRQLTTLEVNVLYFMAFLFLSAWQQGRIWQLSVLYALIVSGILIGLYTYFEKKHMEVEL